MIKKTSSMRQRITIQQPIETQDETGQPVVTWSNFLTNEPAEFTPTGGIESMRGRQLEAKTKAIFRVRYRSGYTTQMKVVFDGVSYGITYVNQVDGLRRHIELMVTS